MIRAVDLYAGAGGASEGLLEAATARGVAVNLTAVNHWPTAVATHTENHPTAQHFCMRIDALDPRIAVPGRKLDILVAAPECTHHSTARGGKPINDQSRAGAWQILHWLDHVRVEHVLIENVPEFRTWGPLNSKDRPIKSKKGDTFRAFINALEQKGYNVEYRVLNAADYGAATTRRRLFIQARRGKKAINWPEPTHSKTGGSTLFGGTKLDQKGILPSTFMLLQPQSWHPDVLTDVARMRTLNMLQAQKGRENHLCPLQFDIVDRAIVQYSQPGEVVFDPFGGLMTVPYCAVKLGRIGLATELNARYFADGASYCAAAVHEMDMPSLFDLGEDEAQPRLPGDVGAVRDIEITDDGTVKRKAADYAAVDRMLA